LRELWWVNQYAITPDLPGGTRHYDLGVEMARRGFRVRIFASDVNLALRRRTKLQPGQLFTVEEREGVEFVWVQSAEYQINNWRRTWNMLSFSRNFMRVARRLGAAGHPAVVIGSSPHPFAALAAERMASNFKARFFLELRDLWPQALIDISGLSEWHPAVITMRMLERYLYARADRLIILAEGSRRYLEERGVPGERTVFLPNGVHLGHFRPRLSREEARQRYGFDQFTIVYAGAHGPANNLETVVRAAQLVEDLPVEFVLVGDGPAKAQLVEGAARARVTNVRFLDPVSKGDVADVLLAADAGVITLKNARAFEYGISPNKLFDYMAASRPVLCSVPGDMARMVQEAQAGVICTPEDPQSLADAVRHMVALPAAEREVFGSNGRDYVSRHFRRETLADRLAQVLCEPDAPRYNNAGD
jgi:glycosyltransferase involved in cell wall biosynthesis